MTIGLTIGLKMRVTSRSLLSLSALPLCVVLAGCQAIAIGPRASSPDVRYSSNSVEARKIQVPPDLSSVSSGDQFIVPGNSASVISRDTLLPVIESSRLIREGGSAWLAVNTTPETLWPNLLAFVEEEGFELNGTLPPAGLITTQWRSRSGSSGSFGSSSNATRVRLSFRLERESSSASRVFARLQTSKDSQVNDQSDWDAQAAHPEKSSIVLQRLLIFLGLDEQRARGLVNQQAAAASILNDSQLSSSAAGTELIIHRAMVPSVRAMSAALDRLGVSVNRKRSTRTSLKIRNTNGLLSSAKNSTEYQLSFNSAHDSKVNVSIADSKGGKLDQDAERDILSVLHKALTS